MFNKMLKALFTIFLMFILASTLIAQPKANNLKQQTNIPSIESLWQEPKNISSLDLYFGEGGSKNIPLAPFKYLKKDTSGSQKKFSVEDANGIKWKVKIGEESQCETVAVRLLWSMGYYTDMTYYLPEIQVEGVFDDNSTGLKKFSTQTFYGARMELVRKEKKIDRWKWHKNPFIGTKEFDGLKVMMMLINNWDLKQENNVILENKGKSKYYVADLGACLGKTGLEIFGRSKNNIKDFSRSKFVQKVSHEKVTFSFHTRPLILLIFYPTYYFERASAGKIAKNVPLSHVKWIGELLSQLSDKQLHDAFRAANYSPEQSQKFVLALRNRINQLTSL